LNLFLYPGNPATAAAPWAQGAAVTPLTHYHLGGTRRRGPGYFLAVAPRRLGLPAPWFDHLGGAAAQVVEPGVTKKKFFFQTLFLLFQEFFFQIAKKNRNQKNFFSKKISKKIFKKKI
jgi:hypothetical protein